MIAPSHPSSPPRKTRSTSLGKPHNGQTIRNRKPHQEQSLKQTITQIVLRVAGSVIGLLGLVLLWFSLSLFSFPHEESGLWMGVFLVFPLLIGLYFLYAALPVWFRFSPAAVKHVCISVAVALFSQLSESIRQDQARPDSWSTVLSLGILLVVISASWYASRRLSRRLFTTKENRINLPEEKS